MKHIITKLQGAAEVSGAADWIRAEAGGAGWKSILFHLYSGILDRDEMVAVAKGFAREFEGAVVAGTLSGGEIEHARLMETGILVSVMLFESTDVGLAIYDEVSGNETETGREIREVIDAIPEIKAVELLLPGTSFSTMQLYREISLCESVVQVFGGYAGGHDMACPDHFVFNEKGIFEDAVFVITYAGADFHINTDKTVGWHTLGMPFKVTKAEGNRLIEINRRPAVEIYEKYLSIDRKDPEFAENTFEFPLMLQVENDELLRHTMSVDEDGALILAGYVKEGMNVFLSYGNPTEIVKKANVRLEALRSFVPQAILLYSCSVRKTFWENFVNVEMMPFDELAPTAGFFTWSEVKRNDKTLSVLEYNITLLSIAMREGEPGEMVPDRVRVDDSVLKGFASLIKRLSQLVSATTTELQKAFDVMSEMNQRLMDMSIRDALTGLYNRGKIELMIEEAIDLASEASPLTLVMVDIDFFKRVNDTYGHGVGDEVLVAVSGLLSLAVMDRENGHAGRWGGEEFFIMLPGIGEEQGMEFAEALRSHIEKFDFSQVGHLTASMGIITVCDGTDNHDEIFTRVDNALYESKQSGRNRVTKASPPPARA